MGIESAIVDCTRGVPVLLRPGVLTAAQIEAACGQRLRSADEMDAAPRASGTLEAHYAPTAKVRLMDAGALQTALDVLASTQTQGPPAIAVWSRAALKVRSATVLARRMPDDAASVAQLLFGVLREFDGQGVKLVWVETPPPLPEWAGVLDRLQRAAAS